MSDPLSITASVAGIISLTIQVSKLLREQIKAYRGALKDAQEILEQVEAISEVLQSLERLLIGDTTKVSFEKTSALITTCDAFHEHMFKLKNTLEKVTEAEGHFKRSLQKCKWIFIVEERREVLKTLQEYLHLFHISLDIEGLEMLAKSVADIKALQIEKADMIRSRLDCLSIIEADTKTTRELIETLNTSTNQSLQRHAISAWLSRLDYSDRHRQVTQSREKDTGQWILDHPTFLDWAHGSHQILVCAGDPGVGKTVTTSAVINSLLREFKEDPTVAVAYVYPSEQFKDKESSVELLGSLILQLSAKLDKIPTDLQEAFEDHSKGQEPLNQEDASVLLASMASKFAQVYIAFDALDECSSRDDFLNMLQSLTPLHKLWITSRPFAMKDYSMFDGALHLSVSAADADIVQYVKARAAKSPKLKRYLEQYPLLLSKMQANVLRKANGVFLIVRYHLDALVQAATRSIQHVRDVLESLPSNMTEVYDAAWGRIMAQDPLDAQIATCVLSWLSCARRPMRKLQILHAASIYTGGLDLEFRSYLSHDCILQPDYILSVCIGLISLDESNDSFGFFHATAASYFRKRFTSQLDGHSIILQCGIAYLSMDYFSKSDFQVDSSIGIIENHPLLDYIPFQFEYHYDRVKASNRQLSRDAILTWLDTMKQFHSDCQAMFDEYESLTENYGTSSREEALLKLTKFGIHPLPRFISRDQGFAEIGTKWWSTRHQRYLAFNNNHAVPSSFGQVHGLGHIPQVGERFMVDISAYPRASSTSAPISTKDVLWNTEWSSVLNSQTDHALFFPPTIKGYSLHGHWCDLPVDEVTGILWLKESFESLVIDQETKELIQALILNRLDVENPSNRELKGNNLVCLLRGGPGTGRTFTAEIIAEIAEKPLYPIRGRDYALGAELEVIESYLKSAFDLGKAWKCVVVLEQADVFLEQRGLEDLQRNELVSVLHRVLESYDGILILITKNFGTLDTALTSRIHVTVHYNNLTVSQRLKIWQKTLEKHGEDQVDLGGLQNYLELLAQNEMSGRQIRNIVMAARRHAKSNKLLNCEILKEIIHTSGN